MWCPTLLAWNINPVSDHLICTPHVPVTIRLGEDQEAVLIITTFGEIIGKYNTMGPFQLLYLFSLYQDLWISQLAEVTGSIDECFISDHTYSGKRHFYNCRMNNKKAELCRVRNENILNKFSGGALTLEHYPCLVWAFHQDSLPDKLNLLRLHCPVRWRNWWKDNFKSIWLWLKGSHPNLTQKELMLVQI